MKRSDDVFFFTLIDFLLQVVFFGLVLFTIGQSLHDDTEKKQQSETAKVDKALQAAGVSNLTELTDELTSLAPLKTLRGMADFVNRNGGIEKLNASSEAVNKAGGADALRIQLDKLKKFEEGTGKPPCLYDLVDGRRNVKTLATVIATDTMISFETKTPELEKMLQLVGRSYEAVKNLPLIDFRNAFSELVQKQPDCRYTLRFIEKTRLVDARDAARFSFYLSIGK